MSLLLVNLSCLTVFSMGGNLILIVVQQVQTVLTMSASWHDLVLNNDSRALTILLSRYFNCWNDPMISRMSSSDVFHILSRNIADSWEKKSSLRFPTSSLLAIFRILTTSLGCLQILQEWKVLLCNVILWYEISIYQFSKKELVHLNSRKRGFALTLM